MTDMNVQIEVAKKAEEGLFDFVFAADTLTALWGDEKPGEIGRQPPSRAFDPLMLMAALSQHTSRTGLICTVNTTYSAPPFTVARMLASLDHMTRGRAGWNLVTGFSPDEALNFTDQPHPPPQVRYERGAEFAEVLFKLWDSWDADAILCDKEGGRYYDPAKMHFADHHGKYFHSKGPLTTPRTPGGRPVTVQAGNSDDGRELAAKVADVAFSVVNSVSAAKAYHDDIKGRAARYGRKPGEILVMPGCHVHVAPTKAEAQAKLDRINNCYDINIALDRLNQLFAVDLKTIPLDGPLPDLPVVPERGDRPHLMKEMARADKLTLRQLAIKFATHGHWVLAGTPANICDTFEAFFHGGGADGFMILAPYLPGSLNDFVEMVVPELQRRGLFRKAYESDTLRGNLGLPDHHRSAAA